MEQMPGNDNDRLARGMVLLAWVVGLAFAAWLFQQQLDRRNNPNRDLPERPGSDGVREVVLLRNAQGHYVADGFIDGHAVTFLLDTGATTVAIPEVLARRWGLDLRPGGYSRTANGVVPVWRTRLDSVQLGPIVLRDVSAVVLPSMGADAEVLLGMSFLKRLELVQRGDRLTLRQP